MFSPKAHNEFEYRTADLYAFKWIQSHKCSWLLISNGTHNWMNTSLRYLAEQFRSIDDLQYLMTGLVVHIFNHRHSVTCKLCVVSHYLPYAVRFCMIFFINLVLSNCCYSADCYHWLYCLKFAIKDAHPLNKLLKLRMVNRAVNIKRTTFKWLNIQLF